MVDTAAQIAAVERAVRTTEADDGLTRVQTLAQTYPSPIDDVWQAVTSGERIARWFVPVTGELRLGGRYQLEGNAGGKVVACEPPDAGAASYRATWEFGGGVTWLTVRLTAIDADRTRLELEHTASGDVVPEELWNQFGPAATGMGWDSMLLGLGLHLTAPDAFPDDPAAWPMTDEGKAFMRGSAGAWAAALDADGADEATAQAAATATYAMYTGEGAAPE